MSIELYEGKTTIYDDEARDSTFNGGAHNWRGIQLFPHSPARESYFQFLMRERQPSERSESADTAIFLWLLATPAEEIIRMATDAREMLVAAWKWADANIPIAEFEKAKEFANRIVTESYAGAITELSDSTAPKKNDAPYPAGRAGSFSESPNQPDGANTQ